MRLLLDKGADCNARVGNNVSLLPLVAAGACVGNNASLLHLAAAGARVGINNHVTLLYLAASRGHEALTRLLLDRGAHCNASTDTGFTALHSAARTGHPAITELLLAKGADVEARTAKHQQRPLHLAINSQDVKTLRNREKVVRLLIQNGADTSATDKYGQTPVSIARTTRNSSISEILSAADSARKRSDCRHQSRRSRDQEL